MKSLATEVESASTFAPKHWETLAVDAVGNVIEFWGFKRNQGRVWAWLYLRDVTLTAAEIERDVDLSKGGVSMLLKDLERWGVVIRTRLPGDPAWRYRAETDLLKMVRRVIEEREFAFIARTKSDIGMARQMAESQGGAPPELLARLKKIELLADATERALKIFLRTSRLDFASLFEIFQK
jgi:HTH-type transcriptional regulator, glycine betaine synthesis regulator